MSKNKAEESVVKVAEDVDDSSVNTRLLDKHYSPLIVRKYQMYGWPLYVALICDLDLSDLDQVVNEASKEAEKLHYVCNNIQGIRNFCGFLTEYIVNHYNKKKTNVVEGAGVLAYWDKTFCSSLYGDLMTHFSCRLELYSIVNTLPHI